MNDEGQRDIYIRERNNSKKKNFHAKHTHSPRP